LELWLGRGERGGELAEHLGMRVQRVQVSRHSS
jgi:hypothetical protein